MVEDFLARVLQSRIDRNSRRERTRDQLCVRESESESESERERHRLCA